MTEIQELREIVQAQAGRLTNTRKIALLNEWRDEQLKNALEDARRDHAVLVKLVKRMGYDLDGYITAEYGAAGRYPYTVSGQREYDAAMHEAEGEPVGHGLVEDVQ